MHEMSIALAVIGQVEDAMRADRPGPPRDPGTPHGATTAPVPNAAEGAPGTDRAGAPDRTSALDVTDPAHAASRANRTKAAHSADAPRGADRTGTLDAPDALGGAGAANRTRRPDAVDALDRAGDAGGRRRVGTVVLRVGELAGVVPEALRFCFELACEGTLVAGAALVVEQVDGRAACEGCVDEWATGMPPQLCCPRCGAAAARLVSGRELEIAGVRWAEGPLAAAREEV